MISVNEVVAHVVSIQRCAQEDLQLDCYVHVLLRKGFIVFGFLSLLPSHLFACIATDSLIKCLRLQAQRAHTEY